ncbi:hypothetical protein, partial [uncultured Alistipes sp.]|uniref:hypothetical protein n=1 Tax=uncultured Alistipes sp. TaxID=538949 RepID=UPI0026F1B583
ARCILFKNYIKPQHRHGALRKQRRCILFKNYIKPQQPRLSFDIFGVVSYLKTTSNHNFDEPGRWSGNVVSYLKTTSNHNHGRLLY